MVVITVQVYVEARVHTIKVENKKLFWVKMIDVQTRLGFKNMPDLLRKEICGIFETKSPTEEQKKKYIKTESEITKKLAEDSTLDSIKNAFEGENIQTHYRVLGYEIDLYFYDYKLAVEIDEKDHQDRDISREIERQKALEKEPGCKFIRINPDKEKFNIFKAQNEILRHIKESNKESTKELTKKPLIYEVSYFQVSY